MYTSADRIQDMGYINLADKDYRHLLPTGSSYSDENTFDNEASSRYDGGLSAQVYRMTFLLATSLTIMSFNYIFKCTQGARISNVLRQTTP